MRTIREIPLGTKLFLLRVIVVPFEVALALTAIWSGISGLFELSVTSAAFNATLPVNAVTGFNLVYVLSGVGILTGVGWGYRNAEASGLILLMTSLVVRMVALYATMGLNLITTNVIIQGVLFGGASLVRLIVLWKRHTTVIVADERTAVELKHIDLAGDKDAA